MRLDDALKGISTFGFDTSPIIYFVEANPTYDALVTNIFRRIENGDISGVTSVISLCQVMIHPLRNNDKKLLFRYREILTRSPHFYTAEITASVAETAAELRAAYNLRTPDALQIAAALENGCDAFLCNDKGLKRVKKLKVLVLDELTLS